MFRPYLIAYRGLRHAFDWSGRTARGEYWSFFLFFVLMYFAAVGADITYFVQGTPGAFGAWLSELFGGKPPVERIYLMIFTLPMISMAIRRLRDRGKSGWYVLPFLIPVLGLVPMAWMLARKGDESANRFGQNPLLLAAQNKKASLWRIAFDQLKGFLRQYSKALPKRQTINQS